MQHAISAYERLARLKQQCNDIVTFFPRSTKALDRLSDVQKQTGIPTGKLIQDVETRWNSSFYMFQSILQQHEAITTTLCLQGKQEMCLTA